MKRIVYPFTALAFIAASAFTVISSQDWKIANNAAVKFDGGDPSGEFGGLKGTLSFDPNDLPGSKMDVTLDVATINTGNGMKNTHAKSAKWKSHRGIHDHRMKPEEYCCGKVGTRQFPAESKIKSSHLA